jgi:hypothetical protein
MITENDGFYELMLNPCTTAVLAGALDATVPWVWIRGHMPKRSIQWWNARVPLSVDGELRDVTVRSLQFDLLLTTSRFLELLPDFHDHALCLFQLRQPVPDTLTLDRVPDASIDRVLVQNGLHLAFYLPHAYEVAQFRAPDRDTIARLLQVPEIRALAYPTT